MSPLFRVSWDIDVGSIALLVDIVFANVPHFSLMFCARLYRLKSACEKGRARLGAAACLLTEYQT